MPEPTYAQTSLGNELMLNIMNITTQIGPTFRAFFLLQAMLACEFSEEELRHISRKLDRFADELSA